jgi:signal transduction histidine kinase
MEPSAHLDHIRQSLHELSQPLAAVTGLVDLLLLEMEQDSSYFWEIRMISEQLERVLSIIGEIRQMAKEAAEELLKAQQTTLD